MIGKTNSVIVSGGSGEDRLKKLLNTTKSCYYLFYFYNGTSVDDLIQPSDTENVTRMVSMFNECDRLTTVPALNTSNVIDMAYMFSGCSKLIAIPQLDTSKVTKMSNMFSNCQTITTIPQFDTSNVTNMNSMFSNCYALTTIPLLDTSKVTNMHYMFSRCGKLTTVPALDVGKVDGMNYMFSNCTNLKSILMTNIGLSLDIHYSTKFERTDLVTILNNLKTVTSTQTLTMGATNLAKLTDEDKAIAINKGWTLA